MPLIFVMYFSDIGQCCRPAQKNGLETQKPATLGISRIIYGIFSKYFRPLHKLGYAGSRSKGSGDRQNSRITDIQTFLRFV